jgi:hypothetical protein
MGPIAPPEPKVDRYLTVQGLAALTRGYAPGAAPRSAQPATALDKAKAAFAGPHPTIVYWDPNRVRISVKRPGQPSKATVFTFRRDKLFTWRLVHIRLPDGRAVAAARDPENGRTLTANRDRCYRRTAPSGGDRHACALCR